MSRRDLHGRSALITGAGTGIGRGIALALARQGAPLLLCGRRPQPLAAVAAEVQALGGQAAVAVGDITDPAARRHLLEAAHDVYGGLHILVNNAGVLAEGGLLQRSGAEIERALATNLTAPIDLTRLALPDLALTQGALVFVGSLMSHVPIPYAPLYSASKGGLHAFCSALRCELTPLGIHLLEVYPPTVTTNMTVSLARRAGRWGVSGAPPEAAGARIVAALAAGREELAWGVGERLLMQVQRCAPRLLAALLAGQRRRLAHIMTPEAQLPEDQPGENHHG